ncbi:MAG: putative succinate-semialdehyde dehydrogenase [NADP(+)] 2 [Turneriella sp.]|nr:putative succinate-semialdehyde dehydrogenase [NADP(+)] 2 [Turneriella sp.]
MPTLEVKNPATGELLKTLDADTVESMRIKYEKARSASLAWKERSLSERINVIKSFRSIAEKNLESAAQTLTSEVGKPIAQSRNEIKGTLTRLDFFLEATQKAVQTETVYPLEKGIKDNLTEQIEHEPLGVIANISAWNYPWFVGSNVYLPALLTGNAVLYKPSEYATLSGFLMAKFLHESGVPVDIFSVICGKGDIGAALLDLPIDGIFFTGSVATGRKIQEAAGKKFIKVQLELGGKDPAYITDNVDVKNAAEATADGAMYNTGQSCCSVERIYVHEKIYDAFVDAFVHTVKNFRKGDPAENETYVGALTRGKAQLDFLLRQIEDAVKKGAVVLTGAKQIPSDAGYFLEPTVVVNVDHTMDLMREESFGPVIGIMKVKDDAEAIEKMNDTDFGLTASVYCNDTVRAKKILSHVNAGSAYINCCDRVSPRLPWSGRGLSGVGLTLSTYGIETFTRPKAWHIKS